jgi:tRNA pseudouridine65 synthase
LTKSTDEIGRRKDKRSAVTDFRRLAIAELPFPVGRYVTARYSFVQARPHTGRQHQIRRHFNHISHPIIGDRKYGDNQHNRFFSDHFECNRLLLAAIALEFTHPYTEKPIRIEAPLDSKFSTMVEKLGWSTILSSGRSHTEYDPHI